MANFKKMETLLIRIKLIIFVFLIIKFYSCRNYEKQKLNDSEIVKINIGLNDSLKIKGYKFCEKIDFFKLEPYEYISKSTNYFAILKKNDTINILKVSNKKIIENREILKYSNHYFIEKKVVDNSDSGEINYMTFYYSNDKIVITCVTKSIYSESSSNSYLSDLFIINRNKIYQYSYKFNYNYNMKDQDFTLDENELNNISNVVLSYFPNSEEVNLSEFKNIDFAKNNTYISQFFLLYAPDYPR